MSDPLAMFAATQRGRPVQGPMESNASYQARMQAWLGKQPLPKAAIAAAFANAPASPPVARPQAEPPQLAAQIFDAMGKAFNPEQNPNEPNIMYGVRRPAQQFFDFMTSGVRGLPQDVAYAFDTKEKAAARAAAAPKTVAAGRTAEIASQAFDPSSRVMNYEARAAGFNTLPASVQTMGQASDFAKSVNKAGVRSSAMGTYQIVGSTLRQYAPKVLGKDWQSKPWSPQNQDAVAEAIFNDHRGSAQALAGQWVSLSLAEAEQVRQMPWAQAKQVIAQKESGGSGGGMVGRVQSGIAQGGGLQTGFDPSFGMAALGELEKGRQAALTPQQFVQSIGQAPEVPTLQTAPPTDFSRADAALEKLRPAEITEKQKLSTRRSEWMRGIGEALMRTPDGVGVGQLLAMVGGGALAGAARGDAEVRDRMDKFDEQMARFNVAVFNNETQKAQVAHQEAVANIEAMNKTALLKYEQQYNIWNKNSNISVQGDRVISSAYDAASGKVTTNVVPIASAVNAAFALQRAQVFGSMGQDYNVGTRMVAQANNSALIGAAATQAQIETSSEAGVGAIASAPAFVASRAVQDGAWPQLVGDENYERLSKDAMTYVTRSGAQPGSKEATELAQKYIATQLATLALGDPKFMKTLMGYQAMAIQGLASEQFQGSRTQTRTGPKGTSTTYTAEAN